MTGRVLAAVAVGCAGAALPAVAQPPGAGAPLLRRADPPTAPRTGFLRAPEWPHGRAHPPSLAGVPDYPYRSAAAPRPTVAVLSLERIPVGRLAGAAPPPDGALASQVYQLPVFRMQADHCFLGRVGVVLHQDGGFQVSFRADQNPTDLPPNPATVGDNPRWTLQTAQLLRNQFHVRVRGYVAGTDTPRGGGELGRAAVWEYAVPPFFVQRGEPYPGFVSGRSDAVRRYFEAIDRVEVEFTYQ